MKHFVAMGWVAVALALFVLAGCDLLDLAFGKNKQVQAVDCSPSDPNALAFDHAICVCETMDKTGSGVTAESFSSFGNNENSAHMGHVGVNGQLSSTGNFRVDGALEVGAGIDGTGNIRVARGLFVGSDFVHTGHVEVAMDAEIGGNLDDHGYFRVDGVMNIAGTIQQRGHMVCEEVYLGAAVAPRMPCNCDPASLIDVAAEVAAHRNAQALQLPNGNGHGELVLASGDYYDGDGQVVQGSSRIKIDGKVRIFVDGNLDLGGSSRFELADDAELDLYVAGSITKIGSLVVGDVRSASRAARVYVGGSDVVTMELRGNQRFAGALYAPRADITWNGNFLVSGSLFARNLIGNGHMIVAYDAGLTGRGEGCETPPGGSGPPDYPGGGTPDDPTGAPTCSETHPELCPGGSWPGDGSGDGSGSGTGSGGGTPGGGDGTGDGSGSGTGTGGSGSGDGSGTGDGSSGGGTGNVFCSEAFPQYCPGGIYGGDGSSSGTGTGGSGTGDGSGTGGSGSGTGTGGSGTGDGSGTGTGGSGSGDGSGTGDGSSGGGTTSVFCSEVTPQYCPNGTYPGDGSGSGTGDGSSGGTGTGGTSGGGSTGPLTCTEQNPC